MNKFLIFLLIIGAVFIFVLGGGAGVLYQTQTQTQKAAPQIEKSQITESTVKELSSKVIVPITANGLVENINGRNITLSSNGDSIIVRVADNAQILSFVADEKGKVSQQKFDFSQIKKGDRISIGLKLLSDGTIEGKNIMIFSPFYFDANSMPADSSKK